MKRKICNEDVRKKAKVNGVFLYEIARQMQISEYTLCRRMRYEMSDNEKYEIFAAIDEIVMEQGALVHE